jgi:hypothetical protein
MECLEFSRARVEFSKIDTIEHAQHMHSGTATMQMHINVQRSRRWGGRSLCEVGHTTAVEQVPARIEA